MGVEFRLSRNDHNKVEDFLAQRPDGVTAITLDTGDARHQIAAAEAAVDAGVAVLFEPATERMTDSGFDVAALSYSVRAPYDVNHLAKSAALREALVAEVVAAHPPVTTVVTPAHFYVHSERSMRLNVSLAEATRHETDKRVRPVLVLNRQFGAEVAPELAAEYVRAGISEIELRITPLGGDDESVRKIQSVFAVAAAFTNAGLTVTLGYSGNIGQAAVALGHVAHYSVGIGLRERVNHAGTISRQKAPPRSAGDGDDDRRGALAGIYLTGLAATVGRRSGGLLLANTDIRTRIGCRLGTCGQSVEGPARDPRAHYLHARADEMSHLLQRPARWRAATEIDRLRRAVELRLLINEHHLTPDLKPIRTRTLTSLINDIEAERAEGAA